MKKLKQSFANAFRGIAYALKHERNMKIHLFATVAVITLAFVLEVSRGEFAVLVLTCALVMSLELVNTAIERLADKVSPEYSLIVKAAKDCAAGAVLIAAIAAVVIGVLILSESIIESKGMFI